MAGPITGQRTPSPTRREMLRWVAVGSALLIAAVNVGLGMVTGDPVFALVGATYGFGVALYLSPLWRPVCYALAALHTGVLGVLWVLDGMPHRATGLAVGVVATVFVVTVLSLFVTERS
ncbi:hypothetical protein [Halomarina litorea]|uniref:hypothetical protein n=1 Tax=Halomarina litorea TaxID=2961595 RepID=UPI0020C2A5E2|nr:hypothetical protein [Halomarina sp. BCD28]